MPLVREGQVLRGKPLAPERGHHSLGLVGRHDPILEPLEEDDRAGQPVDVVQGRAGAVQVAPLRIVTDQAPAEQRGA